MKETWRWYGPIDKITLQEIQQTGAKGIVSALHEIPYGEVWERSAISERRSIIRASGFHWDVVESLPLHEDIKRGTGNLDLLFANYRQSLSNLAAEGIQTICYNFMPLLDWTRTDLKSPVATGGSCLRFSAKRMAAFEIFMVGRKAAEEDYSDDVIQEARTWYEKSSELDQKDLLNSIMSGMPGAFDRYDIKGLRCELETYHGVKKENLRMNYERFLNEIMPTAEELGLRMCVHPDDPPRNLLGLPRIVSTGDDIDWVMKTYNRHANGLTLCSGSLGANPRNDVVEIACNNAGRIHFTHLRNVRTELDGSFEEAAHLEGDINMRALCQVLLEEENTRQINGQSDWEIPFRPDHGHELLSDSERETFPGYPLIGRLRGLAEIRGVIYGLRS